MSSKSHHPKCSGGNRCVCYPGHQAPCICNDENCRCHTAKAYGLRLDVQHGVEVYVRDNTHGATEIVRVLEVTL